MADLASQISDVKNLRRQAVRLNETALSLISLFNEEANRLKRMDEASRLKALYFSTRYQVNQVRCSEDAAEYGHLRAGMITSLGEFALKGIVKRVSKNKRLSALTDSLLEIHANKEPPFGKVLICIGPKGLPDDAEIVCISGLARKSNREEPEIIKELRERGCILLSEEDFSSLIDKLINDIYEGRLRLPISLEKLSEIKASGTSDLEYSDSE